MGLCRNCLIHVLLFPVKQVVYRGRKHQDSKRSSRLAELEVALDEALLLITKMSKPGSSQLQEPWPDPSRVSREPSQEIVLLWQAGTAGTKVLAIHNGALST